MMWAMIAVSSLLLLLAAVPQAVTDRFSLETRRALSFARAPMVACSLAIGLGAAIGLLLNGSG